MNTSIYAPEIRALGAGFDPKKLLRFAHFPLDRFEQLVRRSPEVRKAALYGEPLPFPAEDQDLDSSQLLRSKTVQQQLRRLAAALTLQTAWRTHRTRLKYTYVRFGTVSLVTLAQASSDHGGSVASSGHTSVAASRPGSAPLSRPLSQPDVARDHATAAATLLRRRLHWAFGRPLPDLAHELAVQERMIAQYREYALHIELLGWIPPYYDEFCAMKLQATWKMYRAKRALRRTLEAKRAGHGINYLAQEQERLNVLALRQNQDLAAMRIQRRWRQFWSKKVYQYLRGLIRTREQADPRSILKFINPKESHLMDSAAGVHVRFRLGGTSFPPTIYYKIYVNHATIDLGAFAPRNYANPLDTQKKTWYKRFENNGWRPIIQSVNPFELLQDPVYVQSSYKRIEYPPLPSVRRTDVERKRKRKKVEWMRKMYGIAGPSPPPPAPDDDDADPLPDIDDDMLQWSAALDFDQYARDWYGLATTTTDHERRAAIAALRAIGGGDADQTEDSEEGMVPRPAEVMEGPGSTLSSRVSSARSRGSVQDVRSLFLSNFT
ncbi:hypothetical protein GGF31_004557 [Allomyces arbusculus]|nr:hypothetical protein GGF31_004557 [Allomyces arbusculus]